jgi:hypothetical protein
VRRDVNEEGVLGLERDEQDVRAAPQESPPRRVRFRVQMKVVQAPVREQPVGVSLVAAAPHEQRRHMGRVGGFDGRARARAQVVAAGELAEHIGEAIAVSRPVWIGD